MNRFLFITCFLLGCFSTPAAAQRGFIGAEAGGFSLTDWSPLGGSRRECFTGMATAGISLSQRLDLYTGIGYSRYLQDAYSTKLSDRTQRLEYVELPLMLRLAFNRMPYLRRRDSRKTKEPAGRSGTPRICFYLEGGLIAGILTDARYQGADNMDEFHAGNLKPAIGLGILAGGDRRLKLIGGIRFCSSLRNEYGTGRSPYLYPQNFRLFAVLFHLGLQLRTGT